MKNWLDIEVDGRKLRDYVSGDALGHNAMLDFNVPKAELTLSGEWEEDEIVGGWVKRDKTFIHAQRQRRSAIVEALSFAEIAANAMILEISSKLPPQKTGLPRADHIGLRYQTLGAGEGKAKTYETAREAIAAIRSEILQYAKDTPGDRLWWRTTPPIQVLGGVPFGTTDVLWLARTRLVIGFQKDLYYDDEIAAE